MRKTQLKILDVFLLIQGQQFVKAQLHKPFGEIAKSNKNSTLNMHMPPVIMERLGMVKKLNTRKLKIKQF